MNSKESKKNPVAAFFGAIGKFFKEFGEAAAKGDGAVKASLLVAGAGYWKRKQIIKGFLVTLLEIGLILYTVLIGVPYISQLNTLGTVERAMVYNPATMKNEVNDYDNSLLILLFGVISLSFLIVGILLWMANVRNTYRLQLRAEAGKHINTFKEDCNEMLNDKFHFTLLALPVLGVIIFNIMPLVVMICIAFTNYDKSHMPPNALFTWVGLDNFRELFTSTSTVTFGYAFIRILVWTLIWAFLATFTTYFGGILLAKLINDKTVRWKKMWRSLFVVTIAIPQFVTLLLVGKMFGDYGIVNSICSKIGLTQVLQNLGLVGKGLSYIPFLSKPGWAHVMIVLINIWVGVPYQMLSATGILLNIPEEQLESARIDGANEAQIFHKITMPYMLFVTGPSLITAFIGNINNFNVIYLLTSDYVTGNMRYANSNAKEVDLLVTWLFTLTNDYSNYKMASVIGICVFVLCAVFTLIGFTRMIAGNREEEFQ